MEVRNLQNSYLSVYSISYQKADAQIRGKYAFFMEQLPSFSQEIHSQNLGYAFIVSTCNRTELYTYSSQPKKIVSIFCKIVQVEEEEFYNYAINHTKIDALQHLFKVSTGLESQILGDFEIVNQCKKWIQKCKKHQLTNHYLEKTVNTALQISKKIKSSTELSNGSASVSFSAVNYLVNSPQKIEKILLIGTGKIGQNTCENLIKHLPKVEVTVINRTEEKAEKLAKKYSVKHKKFSELEKEINKTDAIIVSTNAHNPIISKAQITTPNPLILLDLSIPNNVDLQVRELSGVSLLNVDDLSKIVDKTLDTRRKDIPKAEQIIKEYTQEFLQWEETRKYAPIIHNFKENLDFINQYNSKNLQKNNIKINGTETVLAEKLAQKLTNRFAEYILENPDKAQETSEIFKTIFQLEKK